MKPFIKSFHLSFPNENLIQISFQLLFAAVVGLALVMMLLKGFNGPWYRYMFRFVLLFSYIIPISLRVNLDMGKAFYSWQMQNDKEIPGTVVRLTTIPEELGRISYILTDKTGTLTQNEMKLKKLRLASSIHDGENARNLNLIIQQLEPFIFNGSSQVKLYKGEIDTPSGWFEWEAIKALALCHNVTPVKPEEKRNSPTRNVTKVDDKKKSVKSEDETDEITYQASSPDEIALVKWTEKVGVTLFSRNNSSITLQLKSPAARDITPTKKGEQEASSSTASTISMDSYEQIKMDNCKMPAHGNKLHYQILKVFAFTSESKRMGIIVKDSLTGEITFYLKGADVVMSSIVQYNDWLEEECDNFARDGLRTLVVAKKTLTQEEYDEFQTRYDSASMSMSDRALKESAVKETLEREMELLCLTGKFLVHIFSKFRIQTFFLKIFENNILKGRSYPILKLSVVR